jgi:hypothetical protein
MVSETAPRPGRWRARLLAVGIITFWLIATGWLLLTEILPGSFSKVSRGYRSLMRGDLLVSDNWMKISLGDQHIGYSHTSIESDKDNALHQHQILNETELNITLLGEPRVVRVDARASLDALYHLQGFTFNMTSDDYRMRIRAERRSGETFELMVHTAGSTSTLRVEIPDDAVVYSPMMELAMKELKPGRQKRLKTFNPLTMQTEELTVKALRYEDLESLGETVRATVLAAEYQGMEFQTWINADGRVLKQETPFGWRLEVCEAVDALAVPKGAGASEDLIVALSVPSSSPIDEPRTVDRLNVRLTGGVLNSSRLASHRQELHESGDGQMDLTLHRETLPSESLPLAGMPSDLAPFLASTMFIQAEDPDIVKQARAIIGERTNSLAAALAIHDWVHEKMDKTPAISVPSAREVLRVMSGDCNEHTYLAVALARAVGLPARVTVGLVYNEGAFYYHAWPAIYVGRWLEMDPTLGQPAVDATHIRLLDGELRDQMALMGMVGRLKIDILEGDGRRP